MQKIGFLAVGLAALCGSAAAQVVDGTLDAAYGPAIVVQNTQTQFGDNNIGDFEFANGSELDAAHAVINNGNLHLFFTGNLESNFNKMEVFFDTKPGGQNRLRGDNPDVDFNGLNRMGDEGLGNGLTFDPGYAPDYWIGFTYGQSDVFSLFANYAELLTSGGGQGYYMGSTIAQSDGTLVGGAQNPFDIKITLDNSNIAGVTGGNGLGDGSGVTTGMELRIPLAALGVPACDIRVSAFINGQGHDFVSNQVLAGIGGGDNLGEPRNVNFGNVAGNQFFTIINPEARLPGDANGDDQVTGADYTIWADSFGLFNGDAQFDDGDFNCDGFVTGADYTIWADNFGTSGTAVPEPTSIVLGLIGLAACGFVAARRRLG